MLTDRLESPCRLGAIDLKNRVVMAPMTRCRALGNLANELMATYYVQRAEAGLIITEGTAPAPEGLGYARIPALYDEGHVAGWRLVTDAVHAAGSRIFVQLMHTGRVGHPLNMPAGARLLAPSAIAAPGSMYTDQEGPKPHPVPEAMSEDDIEAAVAAIVRAAELAVDAGFDGVELHGANGYLIEQFLNTASNQRSDRWGGSVEGRARFAVEVARRAAAVIGAGRVGIRLSPYGANGGMVTDPDTDALYLHLARELGALGLAYVHLVDHSAMGAPPVPAAIKEGIRAAFGGPVILCGGYDAATAEADLAAGRAELIAFGRPFLANPRLVTKMRRELPLAPPNFALAYTPGPEGYTDYPLE